MLGIGRGNIYMEGYLKLNLQSLLWKSRIVCKWHLTPRGGWPITKSTYNCLNVVYLLQFCVLLYWNFFYLNNSLGSWKQNNIQCMKNKNKFDMIKPYSILEIIFHVKQLYQIVKRLCFCNKLWFYNPFELKFGDGDEENISWVNKVDVNSTF